MHRHLALPLLVCAAACGGSKGTTEPGSTPASAAAHAGNNQQAASTTAVPTAPAVIVKDADGDPVANVSVSFSVTLGGGTVSGGSPKTDASGVARVTSWTLGSSGAQRLTAQVSGLPAVVFDATVIAGTEVTRVTVPTIGGTLEITAPENPYKGLKLTIPSGTFTSANDWTAQVDPNATLPSLPGGMTRNGPAIVISGALARGNHMMTLTVPVATAAGKRTSLILHDPSRGISEVLPTIASTPTSITVMTSHLNPALLIGGTEGSGMFASFRGGAGANALPSTPLIFPIIQDLQPLMDVAVTNSLEKSWFMADLPTPAFPSGHGPAIPVLNKIMNTLHEVNMKILRAAAVSFLADTAAFGTLELVSSKVQLALGGPVFAEYLTAMQGLPKGERDAVVASQISNDMALSMGPIPVALMTQLTTGAPKTYATALTTGGSTIGIKDAGEAVAHSLQFAGTTGMAAVTVKELPGGLLLSVSNVVALGSALIPYETVLPDIKRMVDALQPNATPSLRDAANKTIASLVNLANGILEQRPNDDAPWEEVPEAELVIRSALMQVRTVVQGVAKILVVGDPITGAETGRSAAAAGLKVDLLPGYETAPLLAAKNTIAAALQSVGSLQQQVLPFNFKYFKAPFVITPEEVEINAANRKVDFTASVPKPPVNGYRIRWDWGDGTTPTENLSLNTATHTYVLANTYQVIATLMANNAAKTVLAADTSKVKGEPAPFWKLTSLADLDGLVDGGEDDNEGGQLFDMLGRAKAEPAAALIGLTTSGTTSELFLRIKRTTTWVTCCPPAYTLNDWILPLGAMPQLNFSFGPFFGGWGFTNWSQSSTDLNLGTMNGQYIIEPRQYAIKNAGTQTGPGLGVRITATRNGATLTGTITLTVWPIDELTGEVDAVGGDTFRFAFTATRMQ